MESAEFKAMLTFASQGRFTGPSASSVSDRLPILSDRARSTVRQLVQVLEGRGVKFHVSMDIWSCQLKAVLGIFIHYIDYCSSEWEVQEVPIGFLPAAGQSHTGEWLHTQLCSSLDDMSISPTKIISVHSDNAKNMIAAL